jgi:oxygen-independent coproporphyrinogen-3 oxidase
MSELSEAGLYIHVPFCLRKCCYCDFNSYPFQPEAVKAYCRAIKAELANLASELTISTIYVGGGTPTVLPTSELLAILNGAYAMAGWRYGPPPAAEISVEANPGTINPQQLKALADAGVNRLSIGVQSFDDGVLQSLGRIHTAKQAQEAFYMARQAGFSNINIDLMCGVPGQDEAVLQATLEQALALQPEHISCYSLIVEPGTPMAEMVKSNQVVLPTEDADLAMYWQVIRQLTAAGYVHYEISNFARPGYLCRHNLNYWNNGLYLAAGPGAHSCLGNERLVNEADPTTWARLVCAGWTAVVQRESISKDEQMDETMILGLRLLDGVSLAQFEQRFGQSLLAVYQEQVDKMQKNGLLKFQAGRLMLTSFGLPIANQVFMEFLRNSTLVTE